MTLKELLDDLSQHPQDLMSYELALAGEFIVNVPVDGIEINHAKKQVVFL